MSALQEARQWWSGEDHESLAKGHCALFQTNASVCITVGLGQAGRSVSQWVSSLRARPITKSPTHH